jgi:hypothetical protein
MCIKKFGAQEAFGKPETEEQVLDRFQNAYQLEVEKHGEVFSTSMGTNLALE